MAVKLLGAGNSTGGRMLIVGPDSILGLTLSWAGSAGRGSQAPPPVPTPKTATQPAIQTGCATFAKLFPPIMLSCILRTHDTSRVPQVQLAKNCLGNQVAGGVEAVGIGSLSFFAWHQWRYEEGRKSGTR